jgi:capsular polysaccharide biosynthesis protein
MMQGQVESKAVIFSERVFKRLLTAYPRRHRREYGPAMAQLFRDQCREAWQKTRWLGLASLWVRVLPDLVKTSVSEHLSNLNERKTMLNRIAELLRPRYTPLGLCFGVFVTVSFLVFGVTALVTFLLPDTYASSARIMIERDQTHTPKASEHGTIMGGYDPYFIQNEFEVIQSPVVLDKVIKKLRLNAVWGQKYAGGVPLKTSETSQLLRARIDLRPIRNTSLVEIRVFSEDRDEAAKIANTIAKTYQDYRWEPQRLKLLASENGGKAQIKKLGATESFNSPVEIVDQAVAGVRPVRPNKPLNLALGASGGMLLALSVAGIVASIASLKRRKLAKIAGLADGGHGPHDSGTALVDSSREASVMDKVLGVLWFGFGAVVAGTYLVVEIIELTRFEAKGLWPNLFFGLLFIGFWGCSATMGVLQFRGKALARIYLGVAGVLLAAFFLLALGTPGPIALWFVFVIFGLITACGSFWPRRKAFESTI